MKNSSDKIKPSLSPLKVPRFFVYIIESPSSANLFDNVYEGEMISWGLNLNVIKNVRRVVIDKSNFIKAIEEDLVSQMHSCADCLPIIHISAHGDHKGIQLSNTDSLEWKELQQLLLNASKKIGFYPFLLCMSSCNGYAAILTAIEKDNFPFYAMIGPKGEPSWSDTAVGYVTFYHLLKKGYSPADAVTGMGIASGFDGFEYTTAENIKLAYKEWVKNETAKIANNLKSESN